MNYNCSNFKYINANNLENFNIVCICELGSVLKWCRHIVCFRWNICTCKLSQEAGKGCGIGEGLENKGGGGGKNDGGPSAENLGQIGLFLSDFEKLVLKG